jgi:hypothetical protein
MEGVDGYNPYGWVSISEILMNTKHMPARIKAGLKSFVLLGVLERRKNPTTKEYEYKITERGARAKLNWKSLNLIR